MSERAAILGVAILAGVSGCLGHAPGLGAGAPAVEFATGQVQIVSEADTFMLDVEIAETSRQRAVGLGERRALPDHAGMIFLFEEEQGRDRAFWMYRTRIPLSIAFVDADGIIQATRDMEPCSSPIALFCRRYRPGVAYVQAVEVNRSYFESRGIGIGDRILLLRDRTSATEWSAAATRTDGDDEDHDEAR